MSLEMNIIFLMSNDTSKIIKLIEFIWIISDYMLILNKFLPTNTRYLGISHSKPMKFGIQEDQLMLHLHVDTKFQ